MATQSDSTLAKLIKLKHRIEFLRNLIDPVILVNQLEQELQMAEIEFNYGWTKYAGWNFWFQNISMPKPRQFTHYNQTKLEAIYLALSNVTKD